MQFKIAYSLIFIGVSALGFNIRMGCGAEPNEPPSLDAGLEDALSHLIAVCNEAWKYDNLRPVALRAKWPQGSMFQPPAGPVVHLSPGSPDYRIIVGEIAYWDSMYGSRRSRAADALFGPTTKAVPGDAAPAPRKHPSASGTYQVDDEDAAGEAHRVERQVEHAKASYRRACAWAWPYANLRPMCHQPGLEPATILDPLIPVPTVMLSQGCDDYTLIVTSLAYWEPIAQNGERRLKDLLDDGKAAAEAAAGAGPVAQPPDEAGRFVEMSEEDRFLVQLSDKAWAIERQHFRGTTEAPPVAQSSTEAWGVEQQQFHAVREDHRLTQMAEMYEQMKPALRRWRTAQREVEVLAEPWYEAKRNLAVLQAQAVAIQQQLAFWVNQEMNPKADKVRVQYEEQQLRGQLAALAPQIAAAQQALAAIEHRIAAFRQEQSSLARQTDTLTQKWIYLCDILGRIGHLGHQESLALFDQWIVEEPRLWQVYLARGAARLHAGDHDQAMADLKRVDGKLRLYDLRPSSLAYMTAVQGYALSRQNSTRDAERLFAEAKRLDGKSWAPSFFRGWTNLLRGKYSSARTDFDAALRLSKKKPQAEAKEAMAFLLSTCPTERLRDGAKAIEYATEACELTNEKDWICLDTLRAAFAEAGDFDAAIKSADKALVLAPTERQERIRQCIALYHEKKAYRFR
jgi:tetratricopeptide (TPR) repeat protein